MYKLLTDSQNSTLYECYIFQYMAKIFCVEIKGSIYQKSRYENLVDCRKTKSLMFLNSHLNS